MNVLGISREEEEQQLKKILTVAQHNLERTERHQEELSEQLKDMLDSYNTKDKEVLALWRNTKSLFQERPKQHHK